MSGPYLVETVEPVAFFAYPDRPSVLLPQDCRVVTLADRGEDGRAALAGLAARVGAKPWQAFLRITLPLSRSGIIAGCMLVFIPVVGEFVIPELLGGPETLMIGKVLWNEFFSNRDWPLASAVAVALLAGVRPLLVRRLDLQGRFRPSGTAAHVGRHHAHLVLGDAQHEGAHQQPLDVRVLVGHVQRVVVVGRVVAGVDRPRLDGVGHQPVVAEGELADVRRAGDGGVGAGGLGTQLRRRAGLAGTGRLRGPRAGGTEPRRRCRSRHTVDPG